MWAWGPVTNPTARALACWPCVLWRRHEGARGGGCLLPGCGASGVGRSPTPDRPSFGRVAGARYPLPVGAGGVGVGTRPQPHSARSCEPALRAVGAAGGRPGGGVPLAWVWGVRGWALSHARPPVLRACGRGPLPTGCGCGVCGRGDPSPTPQRALLRTGFARNGGGRRVPGGGASCLGVGRPGLGALPRPTARPWGVRPGPATHWLWVRWVWARGPVANPTTRALASWLCALWGRHEGARGGGASCLGVGRPGLGALPRPTARPWGVRPGRANHWLWVRWVWARGPVANPTTCALASWLCALWGRHEGARGGGASCLGVGRPGLGALPRPTARPSGVRPGRANHWLWVRGVPAWGPVTNPTGGGTRAPGGGVPLAWVWGVRGWALSDARPPVLRACGRGPLSSSCGCGVRAWGPASLAPSPVPRFVVCCARSPGLRHPAAVVAWHLSVCLGCGRRRASLACLVAPRGVPRLVRSGRSRCSGRLCRRRRAFPHPGGLRPWLYWAAARGTRRPACLPSFVPSSPPKESKHH